MNLIGAQRSGKRWETELTFSGDGKLRGVFINVRPPLYLQTAGTKWVRTPNWCVERMDAETIAVVAVYERRKHEAPKDTRTASAARKSRTIQSEGPRGTQLVGRNAKEKDPAAAETGTAGGGGRRVWRGFR